MTTFTVAAGVTRATLVTLADTDELEVAAAGALRVPGDNAVLVTGAATGVEITNDGLIETTGGGGNERAIRFSNTIGGTLNATITNGSGGTIQSSNDAIQIQGSGVTAGLLTIDNDGDINSIDGQALDLAGGTGAFATSISNDGQIYSDNSDAIRVGSGSTIDGFGQISGGRAAGNSDGADGVQVEDGATGVSITTRDDAGGYIQGDRHGINAGQNSNITVVVGSGPGLGGGEVTGHNGSGVGSDGTATVVNYGVITGAFTAGLDLNGSTPGQPDGGGPDGTDDGDGDGIDVDGELTLDNYGLIRGTGAGGTGSDGLSNTSEGIAAGGGTINNYTTGVIQGVGLGILIDDSSQGNAPFLTTIDNQGIITGGTSWAVKIVSDLDDVIYNSGSISSTSGQSILFGTGDNTVFVQDGSSISGVVDGGDGSDTIDYGAYTSGGATIDLGGTGSGVGLLTHFENVRGSAQADDITGDFAANIIDGRGGADQMAGRDGNDLYYVDDAGDVVTELSGEGAADRIASRVDHRIGADADIELLTTQNSTATTEIDLRGNSLAQTIVGNAGANILHDGGVSLLDGSSAGDRLVGLGGNDTYIVYDSSATVVEQAGQGARDKLGAGVDYVLGAGVEIEVLTTTSRAANYAVDLTGNEFDQYVLGNAGTNRLDGGLGADRLEGLGGADVFVFSTSIASGVDTIVDFVSGEDTIELDAAIFTGIPTGPLDASTFEANLTGAATNASTRIVYNSLSGQLFYDADGSGAGAAAQFALLQPLPFAPILGASDVVVV